MTTATQQEPGSRTLLGALACLEVDLAQELQRWQQERRHWGPDFWQQLLANHATPPPETAWCFPPAAAAEPPAEAITQWAPQAEELSALPVEEPPARPTEAAVPDEVAEPTSRPSWSERLNRVFARRQAERCADTAQVFPESFARSQPTPGLASPIVGFALGLLLAAGGTWAVLRVWSRPEPSVAPTLSVPAPPPAPTVSPSPVPNLARKELPDLSAAPATSSPSPTQPDLYYVVMDYQGEQSLLRAQRVVPEAFVWQFETGLKVQLGAFAARDQAEAFVADLKAKGLQAYVYP